ncbi:MAG: L,D-transpeptidase family protein [Verrucomicrobiota bacterium]
MYWYYKYPLIVILLAILFGIGYNIYKRLPDDMLSQTEEESGEPQSGEQQDGDNGSKQEQREKSEDGREAEPNGQERDSTGREEESDNSDGKPRFRPGEGWDVASELDLPELTAKQLKAAREQLDNDNFHAARRLAYEILNQATVERFSATWYKAAIIVSEANTEIINSDIPVPEKERYEVRQGDALGKIARKFNTTIGALIRGNAEIDSDRATIYPGTTLSIYRGDWSIVVDKEEFLLLLMDGDKLFKVYPTALGKGGRTPVGTFVISTKLREPAWTPPGRVIPYGDPENILGTRWLGLTPTGETDQALTGYGIHGTWEPDSIGSNASRGCIRLINEDVEELYDIIPRGVKVTIKDGGERYE